MGTQEMKSAPEEHEIELSYMLDVLWKWKWLIILGTLVGRIAVFRESNAGASRIQGNGNADAHRIEDSITPGTP